MTWYDTAQIGKYELHITLTEHADIDGWKPSAIDGDPLLGDGVKYYLTCYANTKAIAENKINDALIELEKQDLLKYVVRKKIEHIVMDQKVG